MLRFIRSLARAVPIGSLVIFTAVVQSPSISDQAKAAFSSKSSISNVTLDGSFISTEGSSREEGTAHLVAGSDGTYSIALTKSAGAVGETRSRTEADTLCSWSDAAGKKHGLDSFNCITPAWFLPEVPLLLSSETTPEWTPFTQGPSESSLHLRFTYPVTGRTNLTAPPPTAFDMELSTTTLLPTNAKFYLHPDGQSYVNIPVEIIYQDYRPVDGVSIPYHIQKLVNGTLALDITISSANVN